MPGVHIRLTGELPERVDTAAEFGPGFIHLAVREGMSQQQTVEAIRDAWQAIRTHYGVERIQLLEAAS